MSEKTASSPAISAHIAVVIPMYQAEAHIARVLRGIPAFVRTIVVVDDYSPDQSYALAYAVADPRVHFVRHPHNQGVGGAMLSGYHQAVALGAEIIVKMDSDDQMDPALLLPLITPIAQGQADYTKGNRFLHHRQLQAMPPARRVGNLGLSFLTKLASGLWNVFDPTNGYTAIHAGLIPLLDDAVIDRRFFFESSLLLELGLLRAVVRDVYMPARYATETSSLSEWKSLFEFPLRLLKGFARRLWLQYFLRDFGLFAVFLVSGWFLFLFGVVFGAYHWWRGLQSNIATPTGTVMLAVLPIILGVQFLLQAVVLDVQNVPILPIHPRVTAPTENASR